MQYRMNSKNGDKLSLIGFGCMRFPHQHGVIDEEASEKLVVKAIEDGVNYFDTAYVYNRGKSEATLGRILAKGYRDKVKIATKLPHYLVRKTADFENMFKTQLSRLQTDHIDYYLIHMLPDIDVWERMVSLGIKEWIKNKKASGEIINIGFSFHGTSAQFIKLVDVYEWEFCMIQYNYLDTNNQAGTAGLKYAAGKGLPVIVMEPLRGGKLANKLPRDAQTLIEKAEPKRSPAEWALSWVMNHSEVVTVLSGMNEMSQLENNVAIAERVTPGSMTPDDLAFIDQIKAVINRDTKVGCTGCGYCMPCPYGVDIPACFTVYNDKYAMQTKHAMLFYMQNTGAYGKHPGNASICKKCGACVKHCPQSIPIPQKLTEVAKDLEGPLFKVISKVAGRLLGGKTKKPEKN